MPANRRETCFFIFSLFFLLGSIVGGFMGSLFEQNGMLVGFSGTAELGNSNFILIFLRFIRFHALAVFLGSSSFGIVLLPVLIALKGYSISCTAAVIMSAYPDNGIIMALVILGIPSLFSLPCCFLISVESFFSSRKIFDLLRGSSAALRNRLTGLAILCLPVLLTGALMEMILVPRLVSWLTQIA